MDKHKRPYSISAWSLLVTIGLFLTKVASSAISNPSMENAYSNA